MDPPDPEKQNRERPSDNGQVCRRRQLDPPGGERPGVVKANVPGLRNTHGTLGTKGREVRDLLQRFSRRGTQGQRSAFCPTLRGFHERRPLLVKAKTLGVGVPAPRQLLEAPECGLDAGSATGDQRRAGHSGEQIPSGDLEGKPVPSRAVLRLSWGRVRRRGGWA